MTKKIIEEIQQLLVRKRVNFLIGSGASLPAIKLMSSFELPEEQQYQNNVIKYDVDALKEHVKTISWIVTRPEIFDFSDEYFEGDIRDSRSCGRYEVSAGIKDNLMEVSKQYEIFIENISNILDKSNSRDSPKKINIFTTNYDLFVERAVETSIHRNPNLVFNDGANGYFNRKLDSFNYDRSTSYKSQFDSVVVSEELPTISLFKPHGSVNWETGTGGDDSDIFIRNNIVENPVVVPPNGREAESTYIQNHYFEMLRLFQYELSKPESILIVFGFSFGDKHIAKMVQRALSNPQIIVYVFSYSDDGKIQIRENLKPKEGISNLKILGPSDIIEGLSGVDRLDLERLNNHVFKVGSSNVN